MDPDFGMNIVECGFVKDMHVEDASGSVAFRLELTTPACPIKDEFEKQAYSVVEALPWVSEVRCAVCCAQVALTLRSRGKRDMHMGTRLNAVWRETGGARYLDVFSVLRAAALSACS